MQFEFLKWKINALKEEVLAFAVKSSDLWWACSHFLVGWWQHFPDEHKQKDFSFENTKSLICTDLNVTFLNFSSQWEMSCIDALQAVVVVSVSIFLQ